MATQQLLEIVYALDIKFWVRWCPCNMWRMLLPFYLLFLISILFLKTNIRTLNTFKDELARLVMGTIFLVESERAKRAKRTHCCTIVDIFTVYIYIVTKILRKINATTFMENYGKLRVRGMSTCDERTLLPISLDNVILYPFATS